MNIYEREKRLKDLHQKLFANPAERKARQSDTKLCCGKVGIEMAADMLDEVRSEISVIYQRVELATTHLDDGEFARDKKTIESDKRGNGCEFAKQYSGGIPVFSDCLSNGRRGEKQK